MHPLPSTTAFDALERTLQTEKGIDLRDVEDLLAERGIIVSYETIRQWCAKFGPDYARRLKRRCPLPENADL